MTKHPQAYRPLPDSVRGLEDEILAVWADEETFERSVAARDGGEDFVFFEGPPTANGEPGVHHILARTIKDAVVRHRSMSGRHIPRKAGWDTHGLPVELEVERSLGISGKPQIEEFGIRRFNETCRTSVFRYRDEWERLSRDIGYWLDYDAPYVTCSNEFIESCWWALSEIDRRGLLYRGYRVAPSCPRCGTVLSSHELAQGYRDISEPAVHVKFHLEDDPDDARILSWTTTPWTLPGNLALAVGPDIAYARVRLLEAATTGQTAGGPAAAASGAEGGPDGPGGAVVPARRHEGPGGAAPGEVLILARDRIAQVLRHPHEVIGELSGRELAGRRYRPLFGGAVDRAGSAAAWTVLEADFVTVEEGTGVVHTAVMYGEDDFRLGEAAGLPMQHTVGEDGRFLASVPGGLAGMQVKDRRAERAIRDWLVARDQLYLREMYEHSYPHCWRCDSPLLYMARDSWYIRTTEAKARLLEHNASIDWHPPETGSGRMGEWIRNNVDWALSRERYWGTPLPIWVCAENDEHREVLGSFAELGQRAGGLPDDFDPHRPDIDRYEWECAVEGCGGRMRRVPEVADAWFDSGSMPYAQWHYPFENRERLERYFPADFIAEGVDQTRGWFYSLLALSTILFDRAPFRAVIVNDQVLDAQGRKMSKSRGNAVSPRDALDTWGADVTRFYFLSVSNPWVPKRWDPVALRETDRKLFATLRHTYRFFALYANEEGWRHDDRTASPVAGRSDLDRWILARLDRLTTLVGGALERYDLTTGARAIQDFVLDDLSNWYVRRSRDRFWVSGASGAAGAGAAGPGRNGTGPAVRPGAGGPAGQTAIPPGSADAFATLHECLLTASRLLAPFAPFLSDWLHRALAGGESVHLTTYPQPSGHAEPELERAMEDVRRLVALGRAARETAGIRTRQPLRTLHALLPGGRTLEPAMAALAREELNVREVVPLSGHEELVRLHGKPDFGALGPKHGARTPAVAAAIAALGAEPLQRLNGGEAVEIEVGGASVRVAPGEVSIREEPLGGRAVASDAGYVAALDTELDDELRDEGRAREIVNRVQRLRRDAGLRVADRIRLGVAGPEEFERAAAVHAAYIAGETLAVQVRVGAEAPDGVEASSVMIEDHRLDIWVEHASGAEDEQ